MTLIPHKRHSSQQPYPVTWISVLASIPSPCLAHLGFIYWVDAQYWSSLPVELDKIPKHPLPIHKSLSLPFGSRGPLSSHLYQLKSWLAGPLGLSCAGYILASLGALGISHC